MRRIAFSSILTLLTILLLGIAANSSQAGAGGVVRTIPTPIPASGYMLTGATYAEGMLIVIERNLTPALPSKFHKNPL